MQQRNDPNRIIPYVIFLKAFLQTSREKLRFSLHREESLCPFYHGNESVDTVETSKLNSSLREKLKSAPQCLQIKEPSKSKIESKQQNIEGRVSTLLQCLWCIPRFWKFRFMFLHIAWASKTDTTFFTLLCIFEFNSPPFSPETNKAVKLFTLT